jgi:hypothetical protein
LEVIAPRKKIEDLLGTSHVASFGLCAIFLSRPAAVSIEHDGDVLGDVGFIELTLKTILVNSVNQISHLLRLPLEKQTRVES